MMFRIRRAAHEDRDEARALLDSCGLSSSDIFVPGAFYWLARDNALAGFCGLEPDEDAGLLRSIAVRRDARGQGLARALLETALDAARRYSITRIYLFSKDTGAFFESLGWKEVPVKETAEVMRAAPQVKHYNRIGWYPEERAFRRDI